MMYICVQEKEAPCISIKVPNLSSDAVISTCVFQQTSPTKSSDSNCTIFHHVSSLMNDFNDNVKCPILNLSSQFTDFTYLCVES